MKKKILFIVIAVMILIPPVVALAAEITIDGVNVYSYFWTLHNGGIYWTSNTTGYAVYIDQGPDGGYKKTTNGGATWGSQVDAFSCQSTYGMASWADWNTPGNNGALINFAMVGYGSVCNYAYLDTSDDTISGDVLIESLEQIGSPTDLRKNNVSITKTVGNMLAVSFRVIDNGAPGVTDDYGFETSVDGGNTWTTKDDPWETDYDYIRLFPANLSDPDDLWALFWDISANELSLKTYDYSADSWDETSISNNMTDDASYYYVNMDGEIRFYDGHLIVAAWSEQNSATAELRVWDIANSSNITQKTNVTSGSGRTQADVFIDQTNNRIYVSYLKGTIATSTTVYYQYSDDGGNSWSGEITYSAANDLRTVMTAGISNHGGKFMPMYYDNVGANDLLTNLEHSITISSSEFSDPAIAPDYVIDCPTCTDNLTSSGNFTSNETFSGGPPGFALIDEAAESSGAPPIWLWGWVGMFSIMVPGFFITYMERKFGAGNGNLILRMALALIVMGLLVTWGRFDWWMIILYLMVAIAPALMSRQYDWGGAGGVSHQGWIGFCATSWIGLTIINRILEGQFLTASESNWWCSIQLFNEFKVFDLFTLPVLNFQFFTVGIPSLLRWDYSFFGGNAEIIQYLLYTITAVVAFIMFGILIGLLFNAFKAR